MINKTFSSFKNYLIILHLSLFLFTSCTKDRVQPEPVSTFVKPNSFSNKKEAFEYFNGQLAIYGKVFTELAKNPQIKSLVHEEVDKRFDGDDNVLIRTLFKSAKIKGIDLRSLFSDELKRQNIPETVDQLLGSLDNIDGHNLYPQIFIPSYEKFKPTVTAEMKAQPTKLQTNSIHDLGDKKLMPHAPVVMYDNPIIVHYDGDESYIPPYYLGYTTQNDGTFISGIQVTEAMSETFEVWVITPNESVINEGVTQAIPTTFPSDGAQAIYIETMKVKAHKESWIKGASEIFMSYMQSYIDGIKPSTGLYHHALWEMKVLEFDNGGYPYHRTSDQLHLSKFLRRNVKNKSNITINANYAVFGTPTSFVPELWSWNNTRDWYGKHGDWIYYVIYERDAWAHYTADVDIVASNNVPNKTIPVPVYSNNSIYCKGRTQIHPYGVFMGPLWGSIVSQTMVSNNEIEFIGKHKP